VSADDGKAGKGEGHRERLRARLLAGGGDGFHDYELLEYLLGLAIPRRDTKPLAKSLLAEFGNLSTLLAATPAELARVDGLGAGAAAAIKFVEAVALRSLRTAALDRPVLSGWQALLDYLRADQAWLDIERMPPGACRPLFSMRWHSVHCAAKVVCFEVPYSGKRDSSSPETNR